MIQTLESSVKVIKFSECPVCSGHMVDKKKGMKACIDCGTRAYIHDEIDMRLNINRITYKTPKSIRHMVNKPREVQAV